MLNRSIVLFICCSNPGQLSQSKPLLSNDLFIRQLGCLFLVGEWQKHGFVSAMFNQFDFFCWP